MALFEFLGNLSANMSYLLLFNKLLPGVFVCQPASVHGVARFVLPGVICSTQGGAVGSEDLRGKRSRGRSLLKNAARPKGQTSGQTGERLFIMQAVIFIVSSGKSLSPAFGRKSGRFPTPNQARAFTLKGPALKQPLFF